MYPVPFDYSTIDLDLLRQLPVFRLRAGMQLQEEPGNGCALDPPGYPTYFTRSVYNSRGNSLRNGPYTVISDPEDDKKHYVVDNCKLRDLWVPVSIESVRFSYWKVACYKHWHNCFYNESATDRNDRCLVAKSEPKLHYTSRNTGQKTLNQNYRHDAEAYDQWMQKYGSIFTLENAYATRYIQGFYHWFRMEKDEAQHYVLRSPEYFYVFERNNLSKTKPEANNRWWERYSDSTLKVGTGGVAYIDGPLQLLGGSGVQTTMRDVLPESFSVENATVAELMLHFGIAGQVDQVQIEDNSKGTAWVASYTWNGKQLTLPYFAGSLVTDAPTPDQVLSTALEDVRLAEEYSFKEWVAEFGYEDLSQAWDNWNLAQDRLSELEGFLGDLLETFFNAD